MKKKLHNYLYLFSLVLLVFTMICGSHSRFFYTTAATKKPRPLTLTRSVYHKLGLPKSGDIIIPDTVYYKGEKRTVYGIGIGLFRFNNNIYSIKLPATLKRIYPFAFDGCENLKKCELPNGLVEIGYAAFQCCYRLKDLTIPDTVRKIGNFAYNHCSALENKEIYIPASVESIGDHPKFPAHMFYDCGKKETFTAFAVSPESKYYCQEDGILYTKGKKTLVSIPVGKKFANNIYAMPDEVTNLGELSFSRNKNIKTILLSDNLIVDGEMETKEAAAYINHGNDLSVACYAHSNVESYKTKESNPRYCSIEGVLYTKDKKKLLAVPNQYKGVLSVPEGTVSWEKEAFWSETKNDNRTLSEITEIRIPATLTQINEKQIAIINYLVDTYGVSVIVNKKNNTYMVNEKGYISSF